MTHNDFDFHRDLVQPMRDFLKAADAHRSETVNDAQGSGNTSAITGRSPTKSTSTGTASQVGSDVSEMFRQNLDYDWYFTRQRLK